MTISLESTTLLDDTYLDIAYGMDVYGDYFYVGSDTGLTIYDISDKTAPFYVTRILTGSQVYVTAVYVSGDYLYLGVMDFVVSPSFEGIYVYDLTDPENPSKVSEEGGNGGGASGHLSFVDCIKKDGNKLYASAEWGPGLTVIDATDPTNISELGYTTDVKVYGYWTDKYLLATKNDIVYLVGQDYTGSDEGLMIFDCTNPANIIKKSTLDAYFDDPDMEGCAGVVLAPNTNDYILIAGDIGLITVDVSDLTSPFVSSTFTTTPAKYGNDYYLDIVDNMVYIMGFEAISGDDNIYTTGLDVTSPTAPTQGDTWEGLAVLNNGDSTRQIRINGDYIYVISFAYPYLWILSIPSGIQVGDTVLLIPNYGDIYDRAAIKGGAISTGDNVQLYPLKGGTKVAIKEEWSAGDKIIF